MNVIIISQQQQHQRSHSSRQQLDHPEDSISEEEDSETSNWSSEAESDDLQELKPDEEVGCFAFINNDINNSLCSTTITPINSSVYHSSVLLTPSDDSDSSDKHFTYPDNDNTTTTTRDGSPSPSPSPSPLSSASSSSSASPVSSPMMPGLIMSKNSGTGSVMTSLRRFSLAGSSVFKVYDPLTATAADYSTTTAIDCRRAAAAASLRDLHRQRGYSSSSEEEELLAMNIDDDDDDNDEVHGGGGATVARLEHAVRSLDSTGTSPASLSEDDEVSDLFCQTPPEPLIFTSSPPSWVGPSPVAGGSAWSRCSRRNGGGIARSGMAVTGTSGAHQVRRWNRFNQAHSCTDEASGRQTIVMQRPSLDFDKMQRSCFGRKHVHVQNGINKPRVAKVRSFKSCSVTAVHTSPAQLFDPAVFCFRSLSLRHSGGFSRPSNTPS